MKVVKVRSYKSLREARGISQEELAFRAGLHRTAISMIEQAKRSSTLETVEKLAKALAVQPSVARTTTTGTARRASSRR